MRVDDEGARRGSRTRTPDVAPARTPARPALLRPRGLRRGRRPRLRHHRALALLLRLARRAAGPRGPGPGRRHLLQLQPRDDRPVRPRRLGHGRPGRRPRRPGPGRRPHLPGRPGRGAPREPRTRRGRRAAATYSASRSAKCTNTVRSDTPARSAIAFRVGSLPSSETSPSSASSSAAYVHSGSRLRRPRVPESARPGPFPASVSFTGPWWQKGRVSRPDAAGR